MKKLIIIVAAVLICLALGACSSFNVGGRSFSFGSASQKIAFKNNAFIMFDNKPMYFKFGDATTNEYVPQGSDLNTWNTMLGIEIFTQTDSVKQAVRQLIASLKERQISYQILENKNEGQVSVNYVEDKGGYKELFVWKFVNNKPHGVRGYRLTKRFDLNTQTGYAEWQNKQYYINKLLGLRPFAFIY